MTQRIENKDCMDALRKLQPASARLVIADPPYGIGYKSRTGQSVANDDGPYVWWLRAAWEVTAEGGALICFCRWDVQQAFKDAISWAGFRVRSQGIWDKQAHGIGDCKRQLAPAHEVFWFATKGRFAFPNGRPKSIMHVMRPGNSSRTHPTEKPVELMQGLIEMTTRKGDLVVDPFAGTGSAGVAAAKCKRCYVGYETERDYVLIGRRRIREAA